MLATISGESKSDQLVNNVDGYVNPLTNGDFQSLASAHSWFKHLSLNKTNYFNFMCAQNPQESSSSPSSQPFKKDGKLHWYFFVDDQWISKFKDPRIVKILHKHSVPLNPFIYHTFCSKFLFESIVTQRENFKKFNTKPKQELPLINPNFIDSAADHLYEWLISSNYLEAAKVLKDVEEKLNDKSMLTMEILKPDFNKILVLALEDVWLKEIQRQGLQIENACRNIYNDLIENRELINH